MSEPRALVEHFFRHEFGRLVAVLTRSLGVRRLALVEDVVQAALVQALETWSLVDHMLKQQSGENQELAGLTVALSAFPYPASCVCYAVEVAA